MKLLAIDCSTEACSVALYGSQPNSKNKSGQTIAHNHELAARQHTQRLLPMVDQLLANTEISLNQLDAIAFGRGPGSFTGLRICLGAVQGLAFGAELPVIPISSLAALAQTAVNELPELRSDSIAILSAIDARMDEVYWGTYKQHQGLVSLVDDEHLSAPEQLYCPVDGTVKEIAGVGSGWNYAERIPGTRELSRFYPEVLPMAVGVAQLAYGELSAGNVLRADQAVPCYLRDEVAWQKQTD